MEQYEFTDHENVIIKTTAIRSRAWGCISIFLGACQVLLAALALFQTRGGVTLTTISTFVGGLVNAAVGLVFLGVAAGLAGVVATRGNDIMLMMSALRKLSAAFAIQIVVVVVAFAGGFLAAMLAVVT